MNPAAPNYSIGSPAIALTAKPRGLARRARCRHPAKATADTIRGWRPEAYSVICRVTSDSIANVGGSVHARAAQLKLTLDQSVLRMNNRAEDQKLQPDDPEKHSDVAEPTSSTQEFGALKLGATAWPSPPLASTPISTTGKRRRKVVPCPSAVSKSIEP
jgi:hypothetical protein